MPSCTASSGSWTEKGFCLEQPTPIDSKHQETCTHDRGLDMKNSYFTPARGTVTECWWDGLPSHSDTGGLGRRLLLLLPPSGFPVGSVSGTQHSATWWLLVHSGLSVVFLNLRIPLWRAEFKCWKPWCLWGQDVREEVNSASHACNEKRHPSWKKRCVVGSQANWLLITAFTGAVRMWGKVVRTLKITSHTQMENPYISTQQVFFTILFLNLASWHFMVIS